MSKNSPAAQVAWKTVFFTALRIGIGLLWALMAIRFWSEDFAAHLQYYHAVAFDSQPGRLIPWFGMWIGLTSIAGGFFLVFARVITTVIALCLLFGVARRTVYIVAMVAAIPLWPLADGYLVPHALSAFGVSAILVYYLLFFVLMRADKLGIPQWRSIDDSLLETSPGWRLFCGFGPRRGESGWVSAGKAARGWRSLTWLLGMSFAVLISAVIGTLHLGHPASPHPFHISGGAPVAVARDAVAPPPADTMPGSDDVVEFRLEALANAIEVAGGGVMYNGNTFDGIAPGPVLRVRQGQTVKIVFTNKDRLMPHSIDFHSAKIAPSRAFANALYGETVEFSFKAEKPGVFLYHCSTAPVLLHLANGMYGAMIIDPIEPLPEADREYVLLQSEWYTQRVSGKTVMADYNKTASDRADLVVFNGIAFQYNDHPLTAKVGENVRLYFVNAGPNRWSSLHVIGGIFDRVYPDSDLGHVHRDVSVQSVPPGQGNIIDITFTEPGTYPFVDHSMKNMALGAEGVFVVE